MMGVMGVNHGKYPYSYRMVASITSIGQGVNVLVQWWPMKTIAMLTDFGTQDIYVGVMKGVMRGICPDAVFVDLTHSISPQNVRQGALALLNSVRYFPRGTVFLAVVDPGVGGARRPIAVRTRDYTFVAPDNGLLSYVLSTQYEAHLLANYRRAEVSRTFHGRDIFAPAAAHLAEGVPLAEMGAAVTDLIRLPAPALNISGSQISGEVLDIDHFGNITTSIGRLRWTDSGDISLNPIFRHDDLLVAIQAESVQVSIGEHTLKGMYPSYSAVAPGKALVLVGSTGFLEIGVNQGNAARLLGVQIGDAITVRSG